MPFKDKDRQRKAVKNNQDAKRREFYSYKEANPCVSCGGYFRYYQMQFDHVRGEKKYTLGNRSASFGSKEFMKEMAKCDLVCANCHAGRTHRKNMLL